MDWNFILAIIVVILLALGTIGIYLYRAINFNKTLKKKIDKLSQDLDGVLKEKGLQNPDFELTGEFNGNKYVIGITLVGDIDVKYYYSMMIIMEKKNVLDFDLYADILSSNVIALKQKKLEGSTFNHKYSSIKRIDLSQAYLNQHINIIESLFKIGMKKLVIKEGFIRIDFNASGRKIFKYLELNLVKNILDLIDKL